MIVWRVCRAPFADLAGEGARLYGGRWNLPGVAMVYTADSPALAALEVRVHLDLPPDLLPDDYVLLSIDTGGSVPETMVGDAVNRAGFGTEWLRSKRSLLLQVPSIIVPEASNVLINPAHEDAGTVRIARSRPFRFDVRLWS